MANKEPYNLRLKVPKGTTTYLDLIHGEINFDNSTLEDLILMRSDGTPSSIFSSVCDDYMMGISHVIRGEVSAL